MDNFNWVDYIFLAIFFFSVLAGFSRGLVKEVVSLAALIAAFAIATMFSNSLAVYFTSSSAVQSVVTQSSSAMGMNTAQPVSYAAIGFSFALLFIATLIVGAIISFFLSFAFQVGLLGLGNRILGGVFGFGRGFIINLVIIFLVQLTPASAEVWWQQSQLVRKFQPFVVTLGNLVSPSLADLKSRFGNTLNGMGSSLQDVKGQVNGFINR
jgi:membrane protein required for colicin V production